MKNFVYNWKEVDIDHEHTIHVDSMPLLTIFLLLKYSCGQSTTIQDHWQILFYWNNSWLVTDQTIQPITWNYLRISHRILACRNPHETCDPLWNHSFQLTSTSKFDKTSKSWYIHKVCYQSGSCNANWHWCIHGYAIWRYDWWYLSPLQHLTINFNASLTLRDLALEILIIHCSDFEIRNRWIYSPERDEPVKELSGGGGGWAISLTRFSKTGNASWSALHVLKIIFNYGLLNESTCKEAARKSPTFQL